MDRFSKFLEILACQAVNIWLLHPDETLELLRQSGHDPTAFKGQVVQTRRWYRWGSIRTLGKACASPIRMTRGWFSGTLTPDERRSTR